MRIRTIKPGFWRSEDVAALPRDLRLLFAGLWSYVDDNGVGRDDYRLIVADLFALDDPLEAQDFVREGLATLSRTGARVPLIARYAIAGVSYLYVTGFPEHQKVDRPNKPRYPRPPDDWKPPPTSNDSPPNDRSRNHSRETLATDSRDPRDTLAPVVRDKSSKREIHSRSRDNVARPSRDSRDTLASPGFVEFYAAYPRRKDRRAAERAWRAAIKRGADPDQMITAAKVYADLRAPLEFVKHPATWLNAEAYLNEPELANVHSIRRNGRSPSSYDDNGEPLRDPKTGVWMEL